MRPYTARFEMEHLDAINLREPDKSQSEKHPNFKGLIDAYRKIGPAYTGIAPEGIIGIAGVIPVGPGNGAAWMLTSELVKKYPKYFYQMTRDMMNAIVSDFAYHRIQAVVFHENKVACNWMEHLGFQCEGTMRKWGPDREDHYLYAKVVN